VIKRIPLIALQKSLYGLLTAYQTTSIYDYVPEGTPLPYITLGAFTCKPAGVSKDTDISDVSLQVHIWSKHTGKAEINGIAEDVIAVIGHYTIDLSADNFKVMSQEYDMFEAFEEETTGYHGVITFVAKIQNIGG